MRNAFADEITQLAEIDSRIVLLSGDIGNRLFDKFKAKFPTRFFNCGVAEANMASMAAGLAMCGLRPITYTITPFNTTRCLEQIRDDICYHDVPVLVVGTGAGLSYASLGCTHHSCEDISFLRSLPNMSVLCPGDAMELRSLLRCSIAHQHPMYMRIGKTGEPVIHAEPPPLEIGKGFTLQSGSDLCILATGNMLPTALETAKQLQTENLSAEVISFHTVKPLDKELLTSLSKRFSHWISLEEHSLIGGLGSSLAEWIIDNYQQQIRLLRFGTPDYFPHPVGSQKYLRNQYGLEPIPITQKILKEISYADSSRHSR
ncbi:MAG TPA: transketolase C-terminal domain-containing protein [Chlamydiales bacterium]|nr:transketolase C-terminal domain-containing protein [Chlamydiales bacterium]